MTCIAYSHSLLVQKCRSPRAARSSSVVHMEMLAARPFRWALIKGPKRGHVYKKTSEHHISLCLKVLQPIASKRALPAFCMDLNISRSHTVQNAVSEESKTKGFAHCNAALLPLCHIFTGIRDVVSDST